MIIKIIATDASEQTTFFSFPCGISIERNSKANFREKHAESEVTWCEEPSITRVKDNMDYILAEFVDYDGVSRTIITDCKVYLLNENGKTIERIN